VLLLPEFWWMLIVPIAFAGAGTKAQQAAATKAAAILDEAVINRDLQESVSTDGDAIGIAALA
jgi:hypothetical protein